MAANDNADFLDNPFSKDLLQDQGSATNGIHKQNGFNWSGNNRHLLSETGKYCNDVFYIQGDLVTTCQEINMVKVFLSRYPLKNFYLKHDIDEVDYYQYHLGTLIHKVHTLLEIMKLLLNEVYCLKIPPKDCSWINLRKKIKPKSIPMQCIDQYFKAFETLIDRRHLSSHRGKYEDSGKSELNLDYGRLLYKMESTHGYPVSDELQRMYPKIYLEIGIKEYRKERLKEVQQLMTINELFLKQFLTSLHPQYLLQFEKLSTENAS
jgi:hypothetical protein